MPRPTISETAIRAALDAMVAEATSNRLVVNGRIACPAPRYPSEEMTDSLSADLVRP
jgi:hypothetical protein